MDQIDSAGPAPRWFTIAAIGAVLWMLVGCANYWMWVTSDPATLTADMKAIFEATPQWVVIAFAVAVWVGLAGAVLLVMRRRLAEPLLAVSLLAIVVQNSAWLVVPALRNLVGSDDLLLPFVITIVCYGIWQLARTARKAGWLR
jgi:hypothetical protein